MRRERNNWVVRINKDTHKALDMLSVHKGTNMKAEAEIALSRHIKAENQKLEKIEKGVA